jgi:hypothetical protein
VRERIAGYIGVGGPGELGLTNGEWVAIGEEAGQWQTHGVFIALMMDAVRTSETSVNFNVTTRHYLPKDSKLHTHRRRNLKSHRFIHARVLSRAQTVTALWCSG